MKVPCFVLVLAGARASANRPTFFSYQRHAAFAIETTSGATIPTETVTKAKSRLKSLAQQMKEESKTGVFITSPKMKASLKKSVAELEAICGLPTERSRQLMIGNWTLLCTTNSPTGTASLSGEKKSGKKLPFKFSDLSVIPLQNKVQKSFNVMQRIRCLKDESEEGLLQSGSQPMDKIINRVDNIIEFCPFADTLEDIIGNESPLSAFKKLKLNPLKVSKSKVTLAHNAEVQSISPVLRTKIALKSIICEYG